MEIIFESSQLAGTMFFIVAGAVGLIAGLFAWFGRSSYSKSDRDRSERTFFQWVRHCLFQTGRALSAVVAGVCCVSLIIGMQCIWIVENQQVLISQDQVLENGAYLLPFEAGRETMRVERSGSFERTATGQLDAETGAKVDLTLTWQWRMENPQQATGLYSLIEAYGSIEGFIDWKTSALLENPNMLSGLEGNVDDVVTELSQYGIDARVNVHETQSIWRQIPSNGEAMSQTAMNQ